MRKAISYSDAVRLLGGESKVTRLLTGAVLEATPVGGVLSLFDLKDEAVRLANDSVNRLHDQLSGLGRHDRTTRLEAAHAVIVIAAFFQALDEVPLPWKPQELRLTRDEQMGLAGAPHQGGDFVTKLLDAQPAGLRAHRSLKDTLDSLGDYYGDLAEALAKFATGLAVHDRYDTTEWRRATAALTGTLPGLAVRTYEELYRRLALDVPEFRLWLDTIESVSVATGLADLERVLADVAARTGPPQHAAALMLRNRKILERPIAETGDAPPGMRLPSLADAYVNPGFRVAEVTGASNVSGESWWEEVEPRSDIVTFLSRYLTSPEAHTTPLVLLGQPGAGKSVLTKILAGRLLAGDFLPVRVPLREVPADGTLREQIEAAIHQATGERLSWPELVRTAGGALPVIMLDGLDELLQATGVHRSDYLRQIIEFQQSETDLGRSAAVLVTTRTAVADRMRFPEGCLAVRLEPFDDGQVAQWLEVWNRANQAYFAECGRRPLSPDAALRHPDLAAQPLLLLMLALYDADANALQHGDEGLSHADLYERLLLLFAEREVRKHVPGLDKEKLSQEIEIELYRLAVAAFGMFSRGRQRISAAELNDDLANLTVTPAAQTGTFQSPLSGADRVIGRFFFVHRSDAVQDGVTLQTYEFLHATFGEYLVARLLRDELGRVVGRWTAASAGPYFARPGIEDGLLYALLSFALLTERTAILDFLAELFSSLDTAQVKDLLIRLAQGAESRTDQSYSGYLSGQSTFITRHAYYTANLVILAALVEGGVLGSELFPGGGHPRIPWRSLTALWESRISGDALASLTDKVQADRIWNDGDAPDLRIRLTDASEPARVGGFDFAWLSTRQDRQWHLGEGSLRVAHFLCGPTTDALAHAAEPTIDAFEESFDAWSYLTGTKRSQLSPGRIMLEILMDRYTAPGDPTGLYERAFRMLGRANDLIPTATRLRCLAAVLDLIDGEVIAPDRAGPVPEWTPVLASGLRELHDDLAEDGHDAHARTAVEKAVSLYRRVAGADPALCRPELAEALLALSREYVGQGEQQSALRTVEEAVILYRTVAADDATTLPRLAEALRTLATRHLAVKNRAEAVRAARESVAVARGLPQADPVTRRRVLAVCLKTLAEALNHQEEAISVERESVDLYRGLAADDPDGWLPSLKDALDDLSYSLSYRGDLQGALAASRESLSIVRTLEQQDMPRWRRELIWSLDNVAFDLSRLGLHDEAEAASLEAIARCRKDPDIPTNRLGDCMTTLAEVLYLAGQPERALPAAQESVSLFRALDDAQPAQWRTQLARALNALCNVFIGLRDLDRALTAAGESIDLLRAESGDNSGRNLTQALLSRMETLVVQGRHQEASAVAEDALACCEDLRTRTEAIVSWWEVDSLIMAGRRVATEGRPQDAVRLLVKAVEYAEDRETLVIAAYDALRPAWLRRREAVEAAYQEATGGRLPDRVTAGSPTAPITDRRGPCGRRRG